MMELNQMVFTADSDIEAVSVGGGSGQGRCMGSSPGARRALEPSLSPAK